MFVRRLARTYAALPALVGRPGARTAGPNKSDRDEPGCIDGGGASSPAFDASAKYLYLYQVVNDRGTASARPVAELMGAELGWDAARLEDEVDHYLRRVEAERQSQEMATDQEADEARVSAPEGPWAV